MKLGHILALTGIGLILRAIFNFEVAVIMGIATIIALLTAKVERNG